MDTLCCSPWGNAFVITQHRYHQSSTTTRLMRCPVLNCTLLLTWPVHWIPTSERDMPLAEVRCGRAGNLNSVWFSTTLRTTETQRGNFQLYCHWRVALSHYCCCWWCNSSHGILKCALGYDALCWGSKFFYASLDSAFPLLGTLFPREKRVLLLVGLLN